MINTNTKKILKQTSSQPCHSSSLEILRGPCAEFRVATMVWMEGYFPTLRVVTLDKQKTPLVLAQSTGWKEIETSGCKPSSEDMMVVSDTSGNVECSARVNCVSHMWGGENAPWDTAFQWRYSRVRSWDRCLCWYFPLVPKLLPEVSRKGENLFPHELSTAWTQVKAQIPMGAEHLPELVLVRLDWDSSFQRGFLGALLIIPSDSLHFSLLYPDAYDSHFKQTFNLYPHL